MFDHERDSLAEAVGIEKTVLLQEFIDLQRRIMQFLEGDLARFEQTVEYLCEKPRVLVATLLMAARRQTAQVCSLMSEPVNRLSNVLGALAQGASGAPEPYSMRPSEEVEVLSILPREYLATQTILWNVCLLILTTMLISDYEP